MRIVLICLITALHFPQVAASQECDAACLEKVEAYQKWRKRKDDPAKQSLEVMRPLQSVDDFYDMNSDDLFSDQIKKGHEERKFEAIEKLKSP
ncbi:hypothetical protein FIU86_14450 [Roseovarius sp. THAF9]|uniref:hypothetical protein n=1 Tax=Roseovarius sp. THAF9 TaxID=2587847 RepID=UPI0012AA1B5D|nr:hypothetical protein [Roseovarius sp. THAF9]QFT94047.1 hypothetical protein FIU86_14450 [Roseovarius sp. THAF9]